VNALEVNAGVPVQVGSLGPYALNVIDPPAPLAAPDNVAESLIAAPTDTDSFADVTITGCFGVTVSFSPVSPQFPLTGNVAGGSPVYDAIQ
jgi:hypothetical protein